MIKLLAKRFTWNCPHTGWKPLRQKLRPIARNSPLTRNAIVKLTFTLLHSTIIRRAHFLLRHCAALFAGGGGQLRWLTKVVTWSHAVVGHSKFDCFPSGRPRVVHHPEGRLNARHGKIKLIREQTWWVPRMNIFSRRPILPARSEVSFWMWGYRHATVANIRLGLGAN